MKVTISKESVVYQGSAFEDSSWGYVQFPRMYVCPDGMLALTIHDGDDAWEDMGVKTKWCISRDNGLTWERADNHVERVVGDYLPNGDLLQFPLRQGFVCKMCELKGDRVQTQMLPSDKIVKEEDGSWPYADFMYRDIWGMRNYIFDVDKLPDKLFKKEWHGLRIKNGETQAVEEIAKITHPNMSLWGMERWGGENFAMMPPCPYGRRIRADKEGNLWITSYTGPHLNPYNGGVDVNSAAVLYKSCDNGHSFELAGYIPYIPNTTKHPTAHLCDGFTETDMEIMDDGSIIVLLRATGVFRGGPEWNPMYYARSTDGGKTFSEPEEFDNKGVLPNLLKLDCGVTLAAYGRPGIFVRATQDPSGVEWEAPIEIMTEGDRSSLMNNPPERPNFHQWAGSWCNVDLNPIGPNQAIIAFSDFYYPDRSGKTHKKLKTILTRIITIEE